MTSGEARLYLVDLIDALLLCYRILVIYCWNVILALVNSQNICPAYEKITLRQYLSTQLRVGI